jgi:hypothetical protein
MNSTILQIVFLYIIPAILTLVIFYYKEDDIKVKDLIGFIAIALVPLVNILMGYAVGVIVVVSSPNAINRFLNRRIKLNGKRVR